MDSQPTRDTERGLGWDEVRGVLRRRRRLLLGVLLGVWGAVAAYSFLATPVYEASVAIAVHAPGGGAVSGLSSVLPAVGLLTGGSPSLEAHQWLILNPPFIERAAREIGWKKPLKDLLKIVRVEPVGDSLVVVYVQDTNPGRAADYANRLAQLHERDWESQAKEGTGKAMAFLRQQVDQTQKKLTQSEEALRKYKLERGIVDLPTEASKAVSVLGDLAAEVYGAKAESASASRSADYYRRQIADQSEIYVASSTIARNPLVQSLETALAQLESDRAGQVALRGPEHYQVKQLDRQIAQTKAELQKAISTVVQSQVKAENPLWTAAAQALATAEATMHAASAKQSALQGILDREMGKLKGMPNLQTEVGRLELARFVNPEGLKSIGKNLYVETDASGTPITGNPLQDGLGEIMQSMLENSNVEPVRELVDLIMTQRGFELNSQSIQSADEALKVTAALRR